MLELYDRKFVLTREDGKLVNAYHDLSEARMDAKHLCDIHKEERFMVWQLKDEGVRDGETLTRKYTLTETFSSTGSQKVSRIEPELEEKAREEEKPEKMEKDEKAPKEKGPEEKKPEKKKQEEKAVEVKIPEGPSSPLPIVAGVLLLIAGGLAAIGWIWLIAAGGAIAALFSIIGMGEIGVMIMIMGVIGLLGAMFVMLGGVFSIMKRYWPVTLAAAIVGIVLCWGFYCTSTVLCIVGLILVIVARKYFT